jgi:hypothetical protein
LKSCLKEKEPEVKKKKLETSPREKRARMTNKKALEKKETKQRNRQRKVILLHPFQKKEKKKKKKKKKNVFLHPSLQRRIFLRLQRMMTLKMLTKLLVRLSLCQNLTSKEIKKKKIVKIASSFLR